LSAPFAQNLMGEVLIDYPMNKLKIFLFLEK
jgi:hypothetical protein